MYVRDRASETGGDVAGNSMNPSEYSTAWLHIACSHHTVKPLIREPKSFVKVTKRNRVLNSWGSRLRPTVMSGLAIYERDTTALTTHQSTVAAKDVAENTGPDDEAAWGFHRLLRATTETMKPKRSRARAAEMHELDLIFKSQGSGDRVVAYRGKRWKIRTY